MTASGSSATAAETDAIAADRRRHRRRRLRAGADRARRAALGPARARHDHRHHPRHHPRPHRPRDARGDRLRGARRARDAAGPADRAACVDGGAAANDLLCQIQADLLGVPVERPQIVETTALGAAFLAGLGTGVWDSTDDLRETWELDREFTPASPRRTATRPTRRTPCGATASSAPRAGPRAPLAPASGSVGC